MTQVPDSSVPNVIELSGARRCPDFIDAFCEYGRVFNSTQRFVKAGALWMLGTVVTRSVGMLAHGNTLCPNLYTAMIGGPGTGKSQCVKAMRSVIIKATDMSFMPPSITRAGLEDYLNDNLKMRKDTSGIQIYSNECVALTEEMQGILPDQDLGHLTLYNILYDLPSNHKARTRTHGEIKLDLPYCSIYTGAQPAYLATVLPENAWGMGFMSRTMMVFDSPTDRKSAFKSSFHDTKLLGDLIHDLRLVSKLSGHMTWTRNAQALYEEWWVKDGGPPVPTSKRLAVGYNARREIHFFKLAMIMSLSRGSDLLVNEDDAARAIGQLLEFESAMKYIFTEMTNSGSMASIQDIIDMVRLRNATGELVPEADVIHLLMQRLPQSQVNATIDNLISSGTLIIKAGIDARGFRKFQAGKEIPLL